jgi:hypothetical protein
VESLDTEHTERQPRRTCSDCNAGLSSYNEGSRCAPCAQSRRDSEGQPDPEASRTAPASFGSKADEVLSLAQWFLKHPWGPPSPMTLGEGDSPGHLEARPVYHSHEHGVIAGAFFGRFILSGWYEQLEHEVERAAEEIRLDRARGIGATVGYPPESVAWGRAQRALWRRGLVLHTSRHWLFEMSGGMPAVLDIPGLSILDASVEGDESGLTMRVWSACAKLSDLERYIGREVADWHPAQHGHVDPQTTLKAMLFEPQNGRGLPSIVVTMSGSLPLSGAAVRDWYRRGPWGRWKHRLWDGSPELKSFRAKERATVIRGWTLYALQTFGGITTRRDAMSAWNSRAPEPLTLAIGDGALIEREDQAWRESTHARLASDRLTAHLSGAWTLTDS